MRMLVDLEVLVPEFAHGLLPWFDENACSTVMCALEEALFKAASEEDRPPSLLHLQKEIGLAMARASQRNVDERVKNGTIGSPELEKITAEIKGRTEYWDNVLNAVEG